MILCKYEENANNFALEKKWNILCGQSLVHIGNMSVEFLQDLTISHMVRNPQCACPKAQALFTLLGKKWIIFIMQAVDNGATTFTEIGKAVG